MWMEKRIRSGGLATSMESPAAKERFPCRSCTLLLTKLPLNRSLCFTVMFHFVTGTKASHSQSHEPGCTAAHLFTILSHSENSEARFIYKQDFLFFIYKLWFSCNIAILLLGKAEFPKKGGMRSYLTLYPGSCISRSN